VTERHGPLAEIPLGAVSKISTEIAPQVELNTGAAGDVGVPTATHAPSIRERNPDMPLSLDEILQRHSPRPREPEPDREAEP
jgi:hypothetical protein